MFNTFIITSLMFNRIVGFFAKANEERICYKEVFLSKSEEERESN